MAILIYFILLQQYLEPLLYLKFANIFQNR